MCVAAEELAAWVDGGLSEVDASRVEAHLASCPACQALLGAFASTEPVAAASRSRGLTRALLPLAAAAVLVVGVWLAGTRREPLPAPAERQMARFEQPSATLAAPPAPAQPLPEDSAGRQRRDEQASSTLARPTAGRVQNAAPEAVALDEPAQERREADASPAKKTVAGASPAAAAPAPAAAPQAAAADAAAEAAATPQVQAVPPAPQRSRLEGVPANARLASALTDGRLALASPDGASRWRIRGTVLEMSSDGGAAWLPAAGVTPAELADVTSGASPARGVSWLVGRGGLVLVTTEGRRFTRASPPAPVPLTGVEAMDGMTAEVHASDGRAWRTVNAGRTWTQVR